LKITAKEFFYLVVLGVGGFFIVQYFLFAAVRQMPVGPASFIIESGATLLVCFLSVLLFKERFGKNKVFGLAVGLCGLTVLFWNPEIFSQANAFRTGLLFAVFSGLARAFYMIWGKWNKTNLPSEVMLAYAFSAGGLFSFLLGPGEMVAFFQAHGAEPKVYLYFSVLIFLGTVLGFYCCFRGLSLADASLNALIGVTEPMFATFVAFFWMGETISAKDAVGCLLLFASAVILQLRWPKKPGENPDETKCSAENKED